MTTRRSGRSSAGGSNTEDIQVAIVGDSRILFDTDLDRFEALTGVRPLQLALAGTNGRPFLEELAADPDFKGLALVGISENSYFRKEAGLYGDALERYHFESPAQRASFLLYRVAVALSRLSRPRIPVERAADAARSRAAAGCEQSIHEPVETERTTFEERQTFLWSRIETDVYLNGHARAFWAGLNKAPPIPDDIIAMTQEKTRDAVAVDSCARRRCHLPSAAFAWRLLEE